MSFYKFYSYCIQCGNSLNPPIFVLLTPQGRHVLLISIFNDKYIMTTETIIIIRSVYDGFLLKFQKKEIINTQKSTVREVAEIIVNFPQASIQ